MDMARPGSIRARKLVCSERLTKTDFRLNDTSGRRTPWRRRHNCRSACKAATLRDRPAALHRRLWCKWRGPIGYPDQLNWLRSAMIKLKTPEELFKGPRWESSLSPDERTLYDFISYNPAGAHLSSSAIAAILPKLRIRGNYPACHRRRHILLDRLRQSGNPDIGGNHLLDQLIVGCVADSVGDASAEIADD